MDIEDVGFHIAKLNQRYAGIAEAAMVTISQRPRDEVAKGYDR
ncbi:hypothetical protein [Mesorhizobium sp.]|nr:hypothetical protein [Mesorhizobium sp.]